MEGVRIQRVESSDESRDRRQELSRLGGIQPACDLGWSIPIVLVHRSSDERRLLDGIERLGVDVVDADSVVPGVVEVARAHRRGPPDKWRAGASFRPATPKASGDRPLPS